MVPALMTTLASPVPAVCAVMPWEVVPDVLMMPPCKVTVVADVLLALPI